MIYSKTARYAIRALVFLADKQEDSSLNVGEMAGSLNIPAPFLGKILQELRREDLVRSSRGRGGGFALAKASEDISLYDVIACLEDMDQYEECLFGEYTCSMDRACAALCHWSSVKYHHLTFLRTHSVGDLCRALNFRHIKERTA